MIGDLFDSPWKIAIIAIVIIVLFGSRKLPDAARSLGKSMRILKTEVRGLHDDDDAPGSSASTASAASAQPAPAQPAPAQPGQLQAPAPPAAPAPAAEVPAEAKQTR
jgi:sec-independent protein translocase protein TatA